MFLWMVAGGSAADSVSSSEIQQCVGDGSVLTYQECKDSLQAGADVGTGIGVAFIFVLWFFGFVILSIIWFMLSGRPPLGLKPPAPAAYVRHLQEMIAHGLATGPASTGTSGGRPGPRNPPRPRGNPERPPRIQRSRA